MGTTSTNLLRTKPRLKLHKGEIHKLLAARERRVQSWQLGMTRRAQHGIKKMVQWYGHTKYRGGCRRIENKKNSTKKTHRELIEVLKALDTEITTIQNLRQQPAPCTPTTTPAWKRRISRLRKETHRCHHLRKQGIQKVPKPSRVNRQFTPSQEVWAMISTTWHPQAKLTKTNSTKENSSHIYQKSS